LSDKPTDKPINPSVSMGVDMTSFMDYINKQVKDKSQIDAILELLKVENLDFKTEWPSSKYTKWAVKAKTWSESVNQVLHLGEDEKEHLVDFMLNQAMLKMTSHKGHRVQAVVNALRGNDPLKHIYEDNKTRRSFFGLR